MINQRMTVIVVRYFGYIVLGSVRIKYAARHQRGADIDIDLAERRSGKDSEVK